MPLEGEIGTFQRRKSCGPRPPAVPVSAAAPTPMTLRVRCRRFIRLAARGTGRRAICLIRLRLRLKHPRATVAFSEEGAW
jgi:hypothetical protein